MKELKYKNPEGTLRTYEQIAEQSNLGISTVVKLARESGALIKVGKAARVDPEIFFDYVKSKYRVG